MNALASLCLRFAAWLLRKESAEWARAMHSEFQHVAERERLSWAFGCLIAAIKQRLNPMDTGDFRVSRWVMLVETLGCFGPTTLGWYLMTFAQPGTIHYTVSDMKRFYLAQVGGAYTLTMLIAWSVAGLIGPIGLYLGLRYVLSGRALYNRTLGAVLMGVPILLMNGSWIAGVVYGPPDFRPQLDIVTLFFVCLPATGIAHLMYLARPAVPPHTPATA